jgi:aspartate/methionine/tyrosine aminotransferase
MVDAGDEVVIFEPFYPFLLGAIKLAGAVPRAVRMRAPDFVLHEEDVEALISSKTRVLVHNS